MLHQAETGVVGRIAALFRDGLGQFPDRLFEIRGNPSAHFVERRAHEVLQHCVVDHVVGIQHRRNRSVDVEQVVHHQAAADVHFAEQLLALAVRQNIGAGLLQPADDLRKAGNLREFADVAGVVLTHPAALVVVGIVEVGLREFGPLAESADQPRRHGVRRRVEHADDAAFGDIETVLCAAVADIIGPGVGKRQVAGHSVGFILGFGRRKVSREEAAVDFGVEIAFAAAQRDECRSRPGEYFQTFHFRCVVLGCV